MPSEIPSCPVCRRPNMILRVDGDFLCWWCGHIMKNRSLEIGHPCPVEGWRSWASILRQAGASVPGGGMTIGDLLHIEEMLGRQFCGKQWTSGPSAPTAHTCLREIGHVGNCWCGCWSEVDPKYFAESFSGSPPPSVLGCP